MHTEKRQKQIGILALQGAFREHEVMLQKLGAGFREIRQPKDLSDALDGIILPGGESTTQNKLLQETGLFAPLQRRITDGLPVMATCAGLILLAEDLSNDHRSGLATLPVRVRRNAYGRQLGSFSAHDDFAGIGSVPMHFIRAPYIEETLSDDVKVLSRHASHITAVQYKKQLAMSFHPELTSDPHIHQYFLTML